MGRDKGTKTQKRGSGKRRGKSAKGGGTKARRNKNKGNR